jgi:hypothetical protein
MGRLDHRAALAGLYDTKEEAMPDPYASIAQADEASHFLHQPDRPQAELILTGRPLIC